MKTEEQPCFWIDVNEELPDEQCNHLFYLIAIFNHETNRYDVNSVTYIDNQFCDLFGCKIRMNDGKRQITHWMAPPIPPSIYPKIEMKLVNIIKNSIDKLECLLEKLK